MRRFKALLAALAISACVSREAQSPATPTVSSGNLALAFDSVSATTLLEHTKLLASDEYEGRAPGTHGGELAVAYLSKQFQTSGLLPGNPDGTWFQRVPAVGFTPQATFSIRTATGDRLLRWPEEYVVRSRQLQPKVGVDASEMLFVGYGIEAPQHEWDDYKGVDVRGKTVVVLDGEPLEVAKGEPAGPPRTLLGGPNQSWYGTRAHKYEVAAGKGAAAVLVVHEGEDAARTWSSIQAATTRESFEIRPRTATERVSIEGWIARPAFEAICASAGATLETLKAASTSKAFRPLPLNAAASISVESALREIESYNVVARVAGSDPVLKDELVVYTAHWDHLGRDSARAGDQIHNGAIDNAAGVAQLLEIAEGFAQLAPAPRRSVLFIATTLEEKGYLGAKYYVQNPLYPLATTAANINLDACNVWGRTIDVNNLGYGRTSIDALLGEAARRQHRNFVTEPFAGGEYFFLSDQIEFAKVGVPAVFPGSGSTYVGKPDGYGDEKWSDYGSNRYHQVSDEVEEDWDLSGAVEDAQWMLEVGYAIAQADAMPTWTPSDEFELAHVKAPGQISRAHR